MSQPTCNACGAPLLRVSTQSGQRIRLDAAPTPHGSLTWGNLAHTVVRPYCDNDLPDLPRFTIHFATCPNSTRRPKKGGD